ncbi:MAG: hypothetical protein ABI460_03645 [Caldimonas sp.]
MSTVPGALDGGAAPRCPDCGFQVFNRRFPKCESCGALLPEPIVYSAVERHALLVADEERDLERARQEKSGASGAAPSFDDSVLSALMDLTDK